MPESSHEWLKIPANERLRRAAVRAARNHRLRAGDVLQLGAAMVASSFDPLTLRFLSENVFLKKAAEREGLVVGYE